MEMTASQKSAHVAGRIIAITVAAITGALVKEQLGGGAGEEVC